MLLPAGREDSQGRRALSVRGRRGRWGLLRERAARPAQHSAPISAGSCALAGGRGQAARDAAFETGHSHLSVGSCPCRDSLERSDQRFRGARRRGCESGACPMSNVEGPLAEGCAASRNEPTVCRCCAGCGRSETVGNAEADVLRQLPPARRARNAVPGRHAAQNGPKRLPRPAARLHKAVGCTM